jgi:hypothetical protein
MKILRLFPLVLIFILTISCSLLPSGEGESVLSDATSEVEPLVESVVSDQVSEGVAQDEQIISIPPESGSPSAPATNYLYGIQPGSPVRTSSWLHDCKWMGVAGQVFSSTGNPVDNIIVEAGGRLIGRPVLGLSITGLDNGYGPGGYEIMLANQPLKSTQLIWVQLKDIAGQPLSPQIYIDTSEICAENLVILNFAEGGLAQDRFEYYFPIMNK